MHDDVDLVELRGMSLHRAFLTLSQSYDGIPHRLYEPAHALSRARDGRRDLVNRASDLAEMSRATESIFREVLSPFSVVGDQPLAVSATWSVALARWTELLHYHAAELLAGEILPELALRGFRVLTVSEAEERHAAWIHAHFQEQIYPLLTPLAVDPGRPFPYISSDSLNLLVELRGGVRYEPAALMARVKIPSITPRLIRLPGPADASTHSPASPEPAAFVWSIDLVRHYVAELFVSMPIRRVHCFRVLRAPEAFGPYGSEHGAVHGRQARGSVVRVDVDSAMPPALFSWLVDHLDVISFSVVRYDSADSAMSLPQLAAAVQHWIGPTRSP